MFLPRRPWLYPATTSESAETPERHNAIENIDLNTVMAPRTERIHASPLSELERRALTLLVRWIPDRVTPDHLTAFGILGAVVTMAGYAACWLSPAFVWLASLGLAIHWFGDSLDGSLARHRRVERPRYGYFLDQNIDAVGNLMIGVGIGLSPWVDLRVALFALTTYHMLSIYVFVRVHVSGEFHVTVAHSGPTEIRLAIVAMNTLIALFGAPHFVLAGVAMTWCDLAVAFTGAAFLATFLWVVFDYAPVLRADDDRARRERDAAGAAGSGDVNDER
ncbi:CDP-alcohol phosphatidyltransferase family protein [Siculibacillus lacustris]|uniref:CDP-alcohol phosphatidyltransferase family protein n=1 Tax=Siculibacillus lacustris TaxID=1549641 RepID=A0A4Q9VV19_9HYPH|nr:CDP-alcohol phosphatidyltransferase family protein [Siculibacillus lacustris]TBW39546.1 CDP-alcohol phosphatidyltransferase family protein [Siculibacillus lacustris]